MHKKIKVGIVFGGRSGEHEVSLRSAQSVLDAINKDKYDITLIGITKDGRWLTGPQTEAALIGQASLADLGSAANEATLLASPEARGLRHLNTRGARHELGEVSTLDVVFPVLHGTYGEDGTLQGLLELANLPYVGAGVVGSAVGMDKAVFKAVMQGAGIPVLPYVVLTRHDLDTNLNNCIDHIEHVLQYPVFVKPCNLGSSVGISRADSRAELTAGLHQAARWDRRILVEQGISARELEVSVLGNDAPEASVVGEIRPRRAFYDYVAKYVSDDSELLIPAPISEDLSTRIRHLAVQAFKAIDAAGLSRVDFLLDKDNDALYINEINTMPGFTSISMYPKLWEASGLSYSALVDRLIELALDRQRDRDRTVHDFERDTA